MEQLYEYLKEYFVNAQGFIGYLPLELLEIKQGYLKVLLKPDPQNANPFGTVHGGCYYAVADTVAGTAAMTYGNYVTTTTGHIHYLVGAPVEEPLIVETKEIHAGKQLMTYDVSFILPDGRVACRATLEYYVLKKIELN